MVDQSAAVTDLHCDSQLILIGEGKVEVYQVRNNNSVFVFLNRVILPLSTLIGKTNDTAKEKQV